MSNLKCELCSNSIDSNVIQPEYIGKQMCNYCYEDHYDYQQSMLAHTLHEQNNGLI